jgi:hypothetical protein
VFYAVLIFKVGAKEVDDVEKVMLLKNLFSELLIDHAILKEKRFVLGFSQDFIH